jgi:predicted O-linked N-acetylglucosamine transferase (SPINDLY family)
MSKRRQQGTMSAALQSGLEHHRAGRLAQADAIYRKLPNHPDALNLAGVIAYETGRPAQALELLNKAIRLHGSDATYHYHVGLIYRALGRLQEARASYERAVALNPRYVDAHNNLGAVWRDLGDAAQAAACCRKAVAIDPGYVAGYANLGAALKDAGLLDESLASCRHALLLNPQHVGALGNLGATLNELGRYDEAIASAHQALALDAHSVEAHNNLGAALREQGRLDEAAASYRDALVLRPDSAVLHFNLGSLLATQGDACQASTELRAALALAPDLADAANSLGTVLLGQARLDEAVQLFQRAMQHDAARAMALNNLGNVQLHQGQLDQAIASFEQALHGGADAGITYSNLLFSHNYHPTLDAQEIFARYQRWDAQQAAPLEHDLPPAANRPDPGARLKVGYVSGDFRKHSVMHFAAPLIEHHDRARVEIFCYYNAFSVDDQTRRMMAAADHWIACRAMSDRELAERIRADGIDVLVDLSGHTLGNRLLAFARKPAPVQVSWMGFGYTTGLMAMDYFIGDDQFTPPGCESLFSETVYRLPCPPWAYQPQAEAPLPGPLPARARGHVTFGCVSATTRMHAPLIAAWAAILRRLPTARLRLDTGMFRDADLRRDFEQRFAALGVPASQLEIGYTSPVWTVYQDIDIVLDCFPHNSGTTTFEALWMGLPVVTLADRPSVGRFGASILSAIGKQAWIAADAGGYVERAVALAQDVARLEQIRASLRETMRQSPFLAHRAFAHAMENAYRAMWERWCAGRAPSDEQQLRSAMEQHQAGRLQEAASLYAALPDNADALHLRGVIATQTGQHALAVELIGQAIAFDGGQARYHSNLGGAYQSLGQFNAAIASYLDALALDPAFAMAHNNLGNALKESGQYELAIVSFRNALAVKPDYADAYSNLGSVLNHLGRFDEAVASYRQAIAIDPQLAVAHFNLGNAYHAQMKINAAIDSFLAALELNPHLHMAHNNLGLVLKDIGKLDDALICFQNAMALEPDDIGANSNMLFCVNYHATMTPQVIFAAYQDWNARQAARFSGQLPPCSNERDPARRLKVAYVSADFRGHSVIHFAAPLLEHHDPAQVELFCYYNQSVHDSHTERIVAAADHWIPCQAMSDDELAARIRADGIDVLVDISGHTLGNRLLVFARKPAPVQVTWMGFGYSTGLAAMDYFIGDARFTPPGAEAVFAETIYRLPRAPWAYTPQQEAPDAGPLPARANGHVTFACLGTSTRLHTGLIAAWAAILLRLPDARLRLDTRTYADPDLCREVEARFAEFGVAPAQLQIGFTSPVWQIYQQVDIVLDCFPHNCGTTTFEALWMGIPVLSVLDRPSVGRFGASILGAIGKEGWVAPDVASYVELAVAMARDLDALEHERRTLRETMRGSSFLDHAGFARDMEAAYRAMWQQWCKGITS